jgi:hypothetical protein
LNFLIFHTLHVEKLKKEKKKERKKEKKERKKEKWRDSERHYREKAVPLRPSGKSTLRFAALRNLGSGHFEQ